MGRPIKISDELYERLKAKAEADGGTLQAALFCLVEDRAEEIASFEREIAALKGKLLPAVDAVQRLATRLAEVETAMSHMAASVCSLSDLREKDTQAFNSWVETWQMIRPLEDALETSSARVDRIEKRAHEHFWQQ